MRIAFIISVLAQAIARRYLLWLTIKISIDILKRKAILSEVVDISEMLNCSTRTGLTEYSCSAGSNLKANYFLVYRPPIPKLACVGGYIAGK